MLHDPVQTRAYSIPYNIKISVEIANEEVLKVIKSLKTRKLPGIDDITNEMIKCGGEKWYAKVVKLVKSVFFIKSQISVEW